MERLRFSKSDLIVEPTDVVSPYASGDPECETLRRGPWGSSRAC